MVFVFWIVYYIRKVLQYLFIGKNVAHLFRQSYFIRLGFSSCVLVSSVMFPAVSQNQIKSLMNIKVTKKFINAIYEKSPFDWGYVFEPFLFIGSVLTIVHSSELTRDFFFLLNQYFRAS